MCGIAGFYSPDKLYTPFDLSHMTESMVHRGPDANGIFFEDTIGLGHQRLSILDTSVLADQPMISASGRYVIAFNGEIYNYRELAQKYLPNFQFITTSDTELLIELFAILGTTLSYELNGMYAIAIWDKKEETLYLIRDRLGKKPLYYSFDGRNFVFASELKAFKKLPDFKLELNPSAVYQFLHLNFIPEPETIYKDIKKFPSGHFLKLNAHTFDFHGYWKLENHLHQEHHKESFHDAKKHLQHLLDKSVAYRMISDVPLGSFLSGGIDSSIIAAVAQQQSKDPIKTFSIGFQEHAFNESAYARNVAKHLGTDHTEFTVSYKDAAEMIHHLTGIYDEPFGDASAVPTLLVSRLARKHVTVALSGDGADELFMGYGSYTWAKRLHHPFHKMFRSPIKMALKQMSHRYQRASTLYDYESEEDIKSHIFSQEQYFFSNKELKDLLSPDYQRTTVNAYALQKVVRKLSPQEAQSFFDLQYYLKDDLLTKVDRASMHYSLEIRNPFLDNDLVDWAINLPENFKSKNGVAKYILKEVLYQYLPAHLFDRPKQGFALPLKLWLRSELRDLLEDYTSPSLLKHYNIIDHQKITQIKNEYLAGKDYLFNRLWLVIILHKWLKENM